MTLKILNNKISHCDRNKHELNIKVIGEKQITILCYPFEKSPSNKQ